MMERVELSTAESREAEHFIRLAMAGAARAARAGNAPFGAVITAPDGTVVAAEHNRAIETLDPSAHAEINAIRTACRRRRALTLEGCRLYVNKEPCPMCFACLVEARVAALYYGAPGERTAPLALPVAELARHVSGHQPRIYGGILAEEAGRQLRALGRRAPG